MRLLSATFRYYGISPWEIETLYDTLKRSFAVEDEELQPDDPQFVSMVEIGFPIMYGESFFEDFSMDSWHKVKEILKNMKRRRGKKGVKTYVRFAGFDDLLVPLVFPLLSKSDRPYEMGIEKLEYLVDIVPIQLKTVPTGAEEVMYSYDEITFKWSPSIALVSGLNYSFKNDEWVPPKK